MDYELPDGTTLSLDDGATGADAAAAIGAGLARAALAIRVDGELRDLSRPLPENRTPPTHHPRLEILTDRSGDDALALIRHDAAHVLAAAVLELYPGVKISIGPAIDNGFYYDFEFPEGTTVNDSDFAAIEAAMQRHVDADEPFVREDVSVAGCAGALPRRGPALQGRADRGPDPQRRRGHRLPVHQRTVHRPLPRAPRPEHEADQGVQAAVGGGLLLARGLRAARCSRACTGRPSSRPRTWPPSRS